MDPLHLAISLGPLAVYFLFMGLINLSRRPFVTTGARDNAALGIAISGFITAGPLELFLPEAAVARFGAPWVWLLLLVLYVLALTLLVLMSRPRLVIYNIELDELRETLERVVPQLDPKARWAGNCVALPVLGIQFTFDVSPATRNAQIRPAAFMQSYRGWKELEGALQTAFRGAQRGMPNPYGLVLLVFGLLSGGMATWYMVSDPPAVAQALREMLRM